MKPLKTLGYLGLIPFIVCLYLSSEQTIFGVSTQLAFIAYSAVILSFIAGTIWQRDTKNVHDKRYIISNIFSLIAFIALLTPTKLALIILALGYICIFIYENSLSKQKEITTDYMNMRFWLTQIVLLLHISAYITWFG